jgi:hypothetical protein
VVVSGKEETIGELIAKKRAADGYDAKLEALLTKIWLCPYCQRRATILEIVIPVGEPDKAPLCPRCLCEGIEPIDGKPDLSVVVGGKK